MQNFAQERLRRRRTKDLPFFFADANTLYVADDRATAAGGIQKWALAGGTWTLAYTLSPGTNVGCRGLSGTVDNGVVTLYATTTAALAQVVRVVDGEK